MKALILAAGLGTRLLPITKTIPKALATINDITLLELLISKLKRNGINEIIINVHHFADQIIDFVEKENYFGIDIRISDERELLLDTGGGIKNAEWFLNDKTPFLVHNVDVISSIDLNDFADFHVRSGSIASLAVRNRKTSRYFLFDENNTLCGWKNIGTNKQIITKKTGNIQSYAFSGIHVISPQIFNLIDQTGKFSIVDEYLRLSKDYKISAYNHDASLWMDLGNVENLNQAKDIIDLVS
jgi:NDP-sugar pyrophosphorylase family protein